VRISVSGVEYTKVQRAFGEIRILKRGYLVIVRIAGKNCGE